MKKYKIAALLMIIHGGFIELGCCLVFFIITALALDVNIENYFSFIIPYLQENIFLMMIMGGIFGIIRLIGAVGLLINRMWGLVLSVINCVITMLLAFFMLPAGVTDAILACTALVLILIQYYGNRKIIERVS